MSSNNSTNKSTFQSFSTSFSSSSVNGQTTSHSETVHSDPSGTRVHRTSQEPGQAAREERFETDNSGNRIQDGSNSAGRIQDVTDEEQARNDRKYEENIEDEYAKREGGA